MAEPTRSRRRILGIRPRALRTTKGDSHPTEVVIVNEGDPTQTVELAEPQDEIDFILRVFPTGPMRDVVEGEDISTIPQHHVGWDKKQYKSRPRVHASQRRWIQTKKKTRKKPAEGYWQKAAQVRTDFVGLEPGDLVVMSLGGSGQVLARDMAEHGAPMGIEVRRCAPYRLKEEREARGRGDDKSGDAELLTELIVAIPHDFHPVRTIEVEIGELMELETKWARAQAERIAMGNRVHARARRAHLRAHREGTSVRTLEEAVAHELENDTEFQMWDATEKRTFRELGEALDRIPIWRKVLGPVRGIGASLGARILAGVGDVQSFFLKLNADQQRQIDGLSRAVGEADRSGQYARGKQELGEQIQTARNGFERRVMVRQHWLDSGEPDLAAAMQESINLLKQKGQIRRKVFNAGLNKFAAICNAHVMPDGTFARFRRGGSDGPKGRPILKQAGYLFGEQMNRTPDSVWNAHLNQNKVNLRKRHPVVECSHCELPWDDGCTRGTPEGKGVEHKRRYTPAHILRMAKWRTWTQFVRWLYKEWRLLETGKTRA